MKKVVSSKNHRQVTFTQEATTAKYYGVRGTDKLFIMQRDYKNGEFVAISRNGMTHKNNIGYISAVTLEGALEAAIANGFEVLEFDNYKEFFKWLAE